MATSTTRRTARIVMFSACVLAITALVGAIVRQSATTTSAAADIVRLESDGATSLHPMLSLLGNLVAAQSSAVRGQPVDSATLDKALQKVSDQANEYGATLGTNQPFQDLTSQIRQTVARRETGGEAYDSYSGLVTLAVNLMRHTADTSHLIHDPEMDSYFVMDAAIVRLPDAMVYAGRASDLLTLAAKGELVGDSGTRAAVARFSVSNSAEQVSSGLNQSIDFTSRSSLGSTIADRLDAFMAAAGAFSPPTMLRDLSATISDPAGLAAAAGKVYATALPLAHLLISELQALLDDRAAGLAREWRFTLTAAGVAGLIGLVMIWMLAMSRPQGSHVLGAPGRGGERDDLPLSGLTDAQQLLDDEELMHVGRAVRSRSRGRGDAF